MRLYISAVDRLNTIIHLLLAAVFGFVALLTVYQVFARYVLKSPLVWSEELVRYLMIWIVFMGGAIALRKGMMISVEVIQGLVPPNVRRWLGITVSVINLVLFAILIKFGFGIMESLGSQKTGAMDIPVAWTYAAIPVGSCYGALNCLAVLLEQLFKREEVKQDDGAAIL